MDDKDLVVRDNPARERYEVSYGGQTAELAYRVDGGRIVLIHTGVPAALEGHGIAGRLAKFALDDARARGLRVVPQCPYVRAYLEKHPEYADLVASGA
ncbi:MAG: N-acetyltransferase [Chloroflexi bacterium]|nr:N-acetyltransferase [Chloroflexota bacterium]